MWGQQCNYHNYFTAWAKSFFLTYSWQTVSSRWFGEPTDSLKDSSDLQKASITTNFLFVIAKLEASWWTAKWVMKLEVGHDCSFLAFWRLRGSRRGFCGLPAPLPGVSQKKNPLGFLALITTTIWWCQDLVHVRLYMRMTEDRKWLNPHLIFISPVISWS